MPESRTAGRHDRLAAHTLTWGLYLGAYKPFPVQEQSHIAEWALGNRGFSPITKVISALIDFKNPTKEASNHLTQILTSYCLFFSGV